MNLLKRLINKAGWIADAAAWFLMAPFYRSEKALPGDEKTVIGITTFKARYRSCLKPLLRKVSLLLPEHRIIVMANGDINSSEQAAYLEKISAYVGRFSNVELISFSEPRGLSFLWNTIIEQSGKKGALILNDDLKIKISFRNFIRSLSVAEKGIATVNSSWSHFFISQEVIDKVGWFDEGFTEIGGEDDDYLARMAVCGLSPENIITGSITRRKPFGRKKLKVNSYGKNMSEERGGYSTANTVYLESKWQISKEPFEGSVVVPQRNSTYWKLREGRELVISRRKN